MNNTDAICHLGSPENIDSINMNGWGCVLINLYYLKKPKLLVTLFYNLIWPKATVC